jgi:hypothetical protein
MAQYGMLFGILLISLVVLSALLLAGKAAASVRQFREEHHENFVGRRDR